MAGENSVQLREACVKIGSGATPRGGKEAYRGGATSLIRSQNIHNDGFHRDGLVYIDDDQSEELRNVEVKPNDVLLNITGDSVARCCQVASDVLPARVNQHVAIIRTQPKYLDARFLRYVLVSHEYQSQLLALASAGATRPALTKAMIEELVVPSPPLTEQQSIASILGALDDKIELNRRMNATLEAMARTLFQSWFVDFDPVRAKLDGREPTGLDQATAALFSAAFQETKLGRIPLGWTIGKLGDLCTLKRGHDLPTNSRTTGDVPVISSSGVSGKHDVAKAVGPGVVTGRYGTIGKVFFVETDYWPLNTTLYVENFRENPPRYIFHVLGEVNYSNYTDKAAVPGVNRNHLHEEPVVVSPMAVRQAFARLVAPLWTQHLSNEHQSRTLATLRDTLLPQLLSGELSVN